MDKEIVFLIGGSGFIGKNIVSYLYSKYDVFVFDKYIDRVYFENFPSVKFYEVDLIETLFPKAVPSPNYIINLASVVTAERDLSLFDSLISTNLKVLLNLYNRFKNERELKLFIQFGSSEEYGDNQPPFGEELREHPNSPYALVKQLTTNTALMLYINYKFPIAVVRPGNLFGIMQSESKFVPYVVTQLMKNSPLNVSPCMQKRDFISVDDFSCLLEKLFTHYSKCLGEIINISSGQSLALKDIIEYCKTYIGSNSLVNYGALSYRENEIMELKCSVEKLSSIIGEPIQTDVYRGLVYYINSRI